MNTLKETAEKIRRFNRFYLPHFHLLAQKYLDSEYSIAEARVLYEIYEKPGINARDIVGSLQIDKGYLSRLLKKFESRGIIERVNQSEDSRLVSISLTKEGIGVAEKLIRMSNKQVEEVLTGLSAKELRDISRHLDMIINILGGDENANR